MNVSEQSEGKQILRSKRLAAISERKLKANRENAKKSTGPKTTRGKVCSRRNAIKHGLFVNHLTDFEASHEDPHEFHALLDGLWDHYQPIGKAEEIEVERIALCCWRLKRSWRYENAVNLAARRDFVRRELDEQESYCQERDKEEQDVLLELERAKKEIEKTGEVSQELKERIFAIIPGLEAVWCAFTEDTEKRLREPDVVKMLPKLNPPSVSLLVAMNAVVSVIACVESMRNRRMTNVRETAVGRHAIPDERTVDKIFRYESFAEKSLSRALDRLERLQRRRMGEIAPPPLRVHLTR